MDPSPAMIEQVAQGLHEAYVMNRRFEGQTPATNPVLMEWVDLPEHLKDSNRGTARQLWDRLEVFGFDIVPWSEAGVRVSKTELELHLEVLAQMGHIRWVNQRFALGWKYAAGTKNIHERTSPFLVPWRDLPYSEQEKEREIIKDLHRILAGASLAIVRAKVREADAPDLATSSIPAEDIERIARALHEAYAKHRLDDDENVMTNAALRPWERLDPALQHSNREVARQMGRRLATAGYAIVPLEENAPQISKGEFDRHLEALSELGHICWVNERLAMGWTYAEGPKNIAKHTSPALVEWRELSEEEREKDREQLHDLPGILKLAGLKIVRGKVAGGKLVDHILRTDS